MKRNLLALVAMLLVFVSAFAQTPQYLPYQAVARNAAGNLLQTQLVSLRFTVHESTATGTTLYQETQQVTTNSLGLFNVNVGAGTPVMGTFGSIAWGNGNPKFMQVEIDPTGGTTYTNMGATQMMSVPYALYAGNVSTPSTGSVGYWQRNSTTLSPATAGDAITTSGNISTTGSGALAVGGASALTGQVAVATPSPNASAIMDLSGASKGFLPPSMNTASRNAISAPAQGLTIFNTDNDCIDVNMTAGTANWMETCPCNAAPATPGAISGLSGTLCLGSGNTYTASVALVNHAQFYTWTITNGVINSGQGTNSVVVYFNNASGALSVTAGNACGTSGSTAASLTFATVSTPTATGPAIVGYNQTLAAYTISSPVSGATYQWAVSGAATGSLTGVNATTFSPTFNGTIGVSATASVNVTVTTSGACPVSASYSVTGIQVGGNISYYTAQSTTWGGATYAVSSVSVNMWGAGGGGGYYSEGGTGGFVTGNLTIPIGTTLYLTVGSPGAGCTTTQPGAAGAYGGGAAGGTAYNCGGAGGGLTGIAINPGYSTYAAIAGGGGGGGGGFSSGNYVGGGGGGGTNTTGGGGFDFTSGNEGAGAGGGAGASGGTGGTGSTSDNGTNGSSLTGGTGGAGGAGNGDAAGGGGGGGYTGGGGGGGGSASSGANKLSGGGGGGSSLISYPLTAGISFTSGSGTPGSETNSSSSATLTVPGSAATGYHSASIGSAGIYKSAGGPGQIYLQW